MKEQPKQNPTHVRVTFAPQCEVHGWKVGEVYPTARKEIVVPDANGYDIYVHSNLRGYDVLVSSLEYELIEELENA